MRIIKFRAWDSDGKEMFRVMSIHFPTTGPIIVSGRGGSIALNEDDALMEFTGLRDKNGKEIYEGDILQYDMDDKLQFPKIMYFEKGRFVLKDHTHDKFRFDIHGYSEYTVIGNIWENPELLK